MAWNFNTVLELTVVLIEQQMHLPLMLFFFFFSRRFSENGFVVVLVKFKGYLVHLFTYFWIIHSFECSREVAFYKLPKQAAEDLL